MTKEDTIFEFPCEFSIKAMGKTSDDLTELVESLIIPHLSGERLQSRCQGSSNSKFTSVTVTFTAQSKAQLDAMYRALSAHKRLLYVI
jgi:putative lipoic acid-binding regulatory protein